MASIREVARIAGVSPATVSRVINGTANVAPEKRDRVLAAISQTDFVPNEVARSLFKRSAQMIGLIIPSIRNPFFTQLASIMDKVANQNGFRLFLCDVGSDEEKEKAAIQMLISMNADGVIVASSNPEIEQYIQSCPVPVVAVDSWFQSDRVDACIYCDYYQGGRLAMEHLLDCGCKEVVCIRGPQHIFSAKARYEGYRDVCAERGIPQHCVDCDYDFDAGLIMTQQLLETYPNVDGILACNDVVAISTYKVLHKKGISVPEQIQLVGFDDVEWAGLMSPELTTIRQPIQAMAEKAIQRILEAGERGERGEQFVLPVSLVVRETTKKKGT